MFGPAQFAYRKEHGARDAVLYYTLSWICGLNTGCNIGVYCSDVQGAFDKVDADILMGKLFALGLDAQMLSVIRSWLRDRRGFVIVGGAQSRLRNMVFQGTVWGPSVWNAFFGDCVVTIQSCGFDLFLYGRL